MQIPNTLRRGTNVEIRHRRRDGTGFYWTPAVVVQDWHRGYGKMVCMKYLISPLDRTAYFVSCSRNVDNVRPIGQPIVVGNELRMEDVT